jgi:RNA polymerase sigma-70 factor (ECF subfamily)
MEVGAPARGNEPDGSTHGDLMMKRILSWPLLFSSADEQAMCRVKLEDDPQAFACLVQRWQRPIQSLCTRLTGDAHRGEDLAQETFARLFARRKNYEPSGKFSTFLWRIALNLCYDELRKVRRRAELSLDHLDGKGEINVPDFSAEEAAPDACLAERERAEKVRCALQQIAEAYRVVLVLRHYEGLKFREIAEVLCIPEGTVKSRMAEGLTQLNRLLHTVLSEQPKSNSSIPERLLI